MTPTNTEMSTEYQQLTRAQAGIPCSGRESTGKMGGAKDRSRRAMCVTGEAHVQFVTKRRRVVSLTVLLPAHKIDTLLYRSDHERRRRARLLADLSGLATKRLGHLLRVERGLTRSRGGP